MRERPVIFSAPMVRAILAGKKTQTRRPISPQPPSPDAVQKRAGDDYHWIPPDPEFDYWRPVGPVWAVRELMGREPRLGCPFGAPGDRLWVRECWGIAHERAAETEFDYQLIEAKRGCPWAPLVYRASDSCAHEGPWRPSIHMPRWASRITLDVTGVRLERLQDISEDDARAEGYSSSSGSFALPNFRHLWDSLNAKRGAGWERNPWVWVVEFRKAAA